MSYMIPMRYQVRSDKSNQRLDFGQKWAILAVHAARLQSFAILLKHPTVQRVFFHIFMEKKYKIIVCVQCTEVRFTSFPSSGFIITIVVNRLDRNLVYCICHSLLNISLYDSSAEAKLGPIFVRNTAINVTLMQQVTIHVLWSGSICTMD